MNHPVINDVRSVICCYTDSVGAWDGPLRTGQEGSRATTHRPPSTAPEIVAATPDETPATPTGVEMAALKKIEDANPVPRAGEHVSYRSMDGTYWRAVVRSARADGTLSIEVLGNPPLELSHRPWHAGDPADCPKRACTKIIMAEKQR